MDFQNWPSALLLYTCRARIGFHALQYILAEEFIDTSGELDELTGTEESSRARTLKWDGDLLNDPSRGRTKYDDAVGEIECLFHVVGYKDNRLLWMGPE